MNSTKRTPSNTVHMLVDTCVWLDLAKQPDGGKVVSILKQLSEQGKIDILVPAIIITEFERNRDRVQAAMTKSVSSKFSEVRKAISEHGRGENKRKVLDEIDNFTHQVPLVNQLAAQSFDAILILLKSATIISPTAKMKETVIENALTKRAPFHREKNSVADALLVEMYSEIVKSAVPQDNYCFITHNTKDFSDIDGDLRQPHVDFSDYFTSSSSRYFTSLQTALLAYLPDEMTELSLELDFNEEPRALSEVLPYLNKLQEQIWYNRHKNREHRIDAGEIEIVKKYQPGNAHSTIVQDIWQGAQEAAFRVEEDYGLDQLGPWDDFEWGMLNGKLSAIRWMLGEDWETTLDT